MSSSPVTAIPPLLRSTSYHPTAVELRTPGNPPRYVFINPMHIISLQDTTRTFAVRLVEKIKAVSEKWFTHVLLILFLIIYAIIGALIFQWLEKPLEVREKQSIVNTRELAIEMLWNALHVRNQTKDEWMRLAHQRMKEYEGQVEQHFMSKAAPDSETIVWNFWGSLFYCGTVFTTIGYGHIVPATTAGQAVTILYAFIGIPFLLMVLADLGRLFTRCIKAIFYYIKLFYHTGKCRKARRMGRRATAVPAQYISVAWNKMPNMGNQNRMRKRGSFDVTKPVDKDVESGKETEDKEKSKNKNKVKISIDTANSTNPSDEEVQMDEDKETVENMAIGAVTPESIDEEFNLPVTLAVILLVAYMMLGAFIFTWWENWTFFESFYFVFISMSTIGFGDYVPDHPAYMMATFIYLLFGLALTSMCINVVQEKLSATFEMAKLRIGTTIGLDSSIFMEDDIGGDRSDSPESQKKNKDSIKSRRGSKAVPQKKDETADDDGNITETKADTDKTFKRDASLDQMENGIKGKGSNYLDLPETQN